MRQVTAKNKRPLAPFASHTVLSAVAHEKQRWNRHCPLSTKIPFVTLSYAISSNGYLGLKGQRTPLSNSQSLKLTHAVRAVHDGLLVGRGTVEIDDPQLTVRLVEGSNPQPIILDSHLSLGSRQRIFHDKISSPWVLTLVGSDPAMKVKLEGAGARVIEVNTPSQPQSKAKIPEFCALKTLFRLGIKSLMIEGGSEVLGGFSRALRDLPHFFVVTRSIKHLDPHSAIPLNFDPIPHPHQRIVLGGDEVCFGTKNFKTFDHSQRATQNPLNHLRHI
jgi:GTP cyclohydrolase II